MFTSAFRKVGELKLPPYSGTRVMMLPIVLGHRATLPEFVSHYSWTAQRMFDMTDPAHLGKVGYLTIDEKLVLAGRTHRRAGMHVDGGNDRGWGGGGGWASKAHGMLTVSSHVRDAARGLRTLMEKLVRKDLAGSTYIPDQLQSSGTLLGPGEVYWLDGMCVHESLAQPFDVKRQFVRLSMPSTAPWYEGYTENPLGVEPTGEILPRRKFMSEVV